MAQYKLFPDLVNICEGAPAVRLSGALFAANTNNLVDFLKIIL